MQLCMYNVSALGREEGYMVKIPLRLKEFPRAKLEGTPEGEVVYLTVYPELSPNTDSISLVRILPRECIVKNTPSLEGNIDRVKSAFHHLE